MQTDSNRARPPDRRLQRTHRAGVVALLALAAFALSGCETLMVATGQRVRLDGIPLQSISARLDGATALAPGSKAPLSIVATTTDGRTLATVGTGDGKVLADSYVFDASVVTVNAKGVVTLPADPRISEGRMPHVRVHAASQATPVADLDIPIRYDVPYSATYAGHDGMDGIDGQNGMDGMTGSMGSFDPASPSNGGDGGNGTDGGNGGDGGDGDAGPDVHVTLALAPGARALLQVRATESGRDHYFLVDPHGGSLTLAVRGGVAGKAGSAGRGGQAGAGGAGPSPGMSGLAGHDGWDGHAGRSGAAGSVAIAVDPAAARYLDRIHVTNADGDGRPGPAPVVTIAPVASPW